jgi:gamma-glutamyltranspeptidase/glutathione hydrolase
MIATPHVAASIAGLAILRRGGSAVDAAIAANAVLAVVYPASCGLGGDLFALVYEPEKGLCAYNGSGRAPAALHAQQLRDRGLTAMPARGALTVTVPGAPAGWETLAGAHGRFDLPALLEEGESIARDGFVVTDVVAGYAAANEAVIAAEPAAGLLYRGRPVRAGERLANPELAATFAAIRRGGSRAFYEGPVARSIVRTLNALGSPISEADLAAHATEPAAPLRIPWNGLQACAHPPNSQAILGPMVLSMLSGDGGLPQAAWTHTAVEAFKFAFDARDERFGDPAFMQPIDDLLDPAVLARLRARIDPDRARKRTASASPGGTVGIVAVDACGQAVSLIQSLYMAFGSGIVAGGTGVFLQNRGAYFSLLAGHPNELRGGARPVHTLSPGMLLRDGRPELVYATMGGDGQTQTHVQIAHNVYERGLPLQAAIDAPRFVYGRDSESAYADAVKVESRLDPRVIEGLRERGHAVEVLGDFDAALGHAHAIAIDRASGTLSGASDPRADSAALPL